jgi:ribonuclease J
MENCDLRIIPLGGLGEIGLNMTLYEHGDDIIIVDCGLMFPEPSMLGIDLVIPDISYLRENADRVRGIFLTHGHEDHIGALPFILPELPVPIYGTALTLGFVRGKLKEYELESLVELHVVKPRTIVDIGNFAVEFIRVAHSIVDGCALAIRSLEGTVIHTGDFKLDQTPVDGELTDLATLSRYGEEGVLALLSDSTNVEREGFTLSESLVGDAFDEIFPLCPGRIIVAAFSSNIHRVQQVVDSAERCGRKVLLNGRSMLTNVQIARELGYLRIPDNLLVELKDLPNLPKNQICMITTGSQGEPMSGLSRIAMDDHKNKTGAGIPSSSSRFIPGNEKTTRPHHHLYRRGAEVYHAVVSEVHVPARQSGRVDDAQSGTPPLLHTDHGEYRHLVKKQPCPSHIPERDDPVVNGDIITFSNGSGQISGTVESDGSS